MNERLSIDKIVNSEHKGASKVIFFTSIALAFVLALSAVVAILLLLFPVTEIEVVGDSRYTYTEIIEASGVKKGARLYYVNEGKAQRKTLDNLPYLESVTVNSYFPNRVKIEIHEFDDIFLVAHEMGYCYVNANFEILEIVDSVPSFDKFKDVFVRTENPISGDVGTVYEGEDKQRTLELVEYLKEYGFYQYLNIVDVRGKYNVSFVAGKRYKFVLGSMADIGEKIDVSYKVCFTNDFKRDENCIIDSTDKRKVVLRYVDDELIVKEFDFCEN